MAKFVFVMNVQQNNDPLGEPLDFGHSTLGNPVRPSVARESIGKGGGTLYACSLGCFGEIK